MFFCLKMVTFDTKPIVLILNVKINYYFWDRNLPFWAPKVTFFWRKKMSWDQNCNKYEIRGLKSSILKNGTKITIKIKKELKKLKSSQFMSWKICLTLKIKLPPPLIEEHWYFSHFFFINIISINWIVMNWVLIVLN